MIPLSLRRANEVLVDDQFTRSSSRSFSSRSHRQSRTFLHSVTDPPLSSSHTNSGSVPTPENVFNTHAKALSLWNSIYEPHASKLLVKLAESHPDLPVHILNSHYGPLLSDPSPIASIARGKIGRILTSVVAISCLRAQQGVAPQVASHVYGLLNSGEPNSGAESEEKIEGHEFLTSDQGSLWVLGEVDRIVSTVAGEEKMFGGPKAAARL